jgi:hypothetical protein
MPDVTTPAAAGAAATAGAQATASSKRLRLVFVVLAILALAAVWPAFLGFRWYHLKRFAVVRPGVLYRSGQPTELGFRWLVGQYQVKTVLSLRPDNPHLHRGWLDPGEPDGRGEAEHLEKSGLRQIQWPMADEACWPWFTPWQYEQFFQLFDEPANLPVAVHCVGGRHRTGTAVALYRLEYDRWPIDRVVPELLSFHYGQPVPLCDVNLRTYRPRPLPTPSQWSEMRTRFSPPGKAPADYHELVRRLRQEVDALGGIAFRQYLDRRRPFSLPLAQRLIDAPDHELAGLAAQSASECLERGRAEPDDWFAAAALVADFGTPAQQRRLLEILERELKSSAPSKRYPHVAAGVMNRFTRNRLAYLKPLLRDERPWPEPGAAGYRFCDAAAGRLAAIVDVDFLNFTTDWQAGVAKARRCYAAHEREIRLSRLLPPTGKNPIVRAASKSGENLNRIDWD